MSKMTLTISCIIILILLGLLWVGEKIGYVNVRIDRRHSTIVKAGHPLCPAK